jgi:formate--tetrahydrofolate ligase
MGVRSAISEVVARGGEGGIELAQEVLKALEQDQNNFHPVYDPEMPIKTKIGILAREIYGADGVVYTPAADREIARMTKLGLDKMPICIAKTQHSLTDNPDLKGAPTGWELTVREIRASAGAGFLVALTGDVMTMPGLPKVPAAEGVDIDEDGKIVGLF